MTEEKEDKQEEVTTVVKPEEQPMAFVCTSYYGCRKPKGECEAKGYCAE